MVADDYPALKHYKRLQTLPYRYFGTAKSGLHFSHGTPACILPLIMNRKFNFLVAFSLTTLCVASAFAYSGTCNREYRVTHRQSPAAHAVRAEPRRITPRFHTEPRQITPRVRTEPRQIAPQRHNEQKLGQPARRFSLPTGRVHERGGRVYPHPQASPYAPPVPGAQSGRMSPEQRRALRRQINEANQDIRYQRRR